jgi:hypothetical protein
MAGISAVVGALSALQRGTAGVKSLQEYHAQAAVEAPA